MHRYSYDNGHLLFMPYTREPDSTSYPKTKLGGLMNVTQAFAKMLKHVVNPDGSKVGNTIGMSAVAAIRLHLHVQMVPPGSEILAM